MDSGVAAYLARMEAAVKASHAAMQKLSSENKELKIRISELEVQLNQSNDMLQKASVRANKRICDVQRGSLPKKSKQNIITIASSNDNREMDINDDTIVPVTEDSPAVHSDNLINSQIKNKQGEDIPVDDENQIEIDNHINNSFIEDQLIDNAELNKMQSSDDDESDSMSTSTLSSDNYNEITITTVDMLPLPEITDASSTTNIENLPSGSLETLIENLNKTNYATSAAKLKSMSEEALAGLFFSAITSAVSCKILNEIGDYYNIHELCESSEIGERYELIVRFLVDIEKKATWTKVPTLVPLCGKKLLLQLAERTFAAAKSSFGSYDYYKLVMFGSLVLQDDETRLRSVKCHTSNQLLNIQLAVMCYLIVKIAFLMSPVVSDCVPTLVNEAVSLTGTTAVWGLSVGILHSLYSIKKKILEQSNIESAGYLTTSNLVSINNLISYVTNAVTYCCSVSHEVTHSLSLDFPTGYEEWSCHGRIDSELELAKLQSSRISLFSTSSLFSAEERRISLEKLRRIVGRWTSSAKNSEQHDDAEHASGSYQSIGNKSHLITKKLGIWDSMLSIDSSFDNSAIVIDESRLTGLFAMIGLSKFKPFATNILEMMTSNNFNALLARVDLNQFEDFCKIFDFLHSHLVNESSSVDPPVQPWYSCDRFASFWKSQFMSCTEKNFTEFACCWNCLDELLITSLISEYNVVDNGWKVGSLGKGSGLHMLCSPVLSASAQQLKTLQLLLKSNDQCVFHSTVSNPEEDCFVRSSLTRQEAIQTFDLLCEIRQIFEAADSAGTFCEWGALFTNISRLFTLMSLSALEQVIFVASQSCLSFVEVIVLQIEQNFPGNRHLSSSAFACGFCCLRTLQNLCDNFGVITAAQSLFWTSRFLRCYENAEMSVSKAIPAVLSDSMHKSIMWATKELGKIPSVVINLARRPDRLRRIIRLSRNIGLHTLRFPAVDGEKDFSSSLTEFVCSSWDSSLNCKFDESCLQNDNTTLTASERACALSHLLVWVSIASLDCSYVDESKNKKKVSTRLSLISECVLAFENEKNIAYNDWLNVLRLNWNWSLNKLANFAYEVRNIAEGTSFGNYVLILEDDAVLRNQQMKMNVAEKIKRICLVLPQNCELCYLGYAVNWSMQTDKNKYSKHMFFTPTYLWQLHSYLLSPLGAQKLLDYLPINAPVDNFVARLVYEQKIKALALQDQLMNQREGKSIVPNSGKSKDSDIFHSAKIGAWRRNASTSDQTLKQRKQSEGKKSNGFSTKQRK